MKSLLRISVAASALISLPAIAHAQDQVTADADSASGTQLQDIVVTAQRRSENLQRAAIAATAVTGDLLRASGVSDPRALTKLVPSLQVSSANGPYSNFYLRGVGNFNGNSLSESAVAFNYDGVFIGRPSSTTGFFYDLERVEVLKGPQGTLYGRNATGGAINVIPSKPDFDFGAAFSAEYGNYDAARLDGMLNVPVNERVAVRAAGILVRHDGYMKDGTDDQKDYGGRLQVRIDATPDLKLVLGADYFHQAGNGIGSTPVDIGIDARDGLTSPAGQALYRTIPHTLGGRTFDGIPPIQFQQNEFWGLSGIATWTGDIGSITVIPAYRRSTLRNLNTNVGFYIFQREKNEQTSIEVRYASPESKPLRVLLGGFYYDESTDSPRFLVNHQFNHFDQTVQTGTRSAAAFGRLTYAPTESFRITGGLRYTHEKKRYDGTLLSLSRICLAGLFSCPGSIAFPYTTDRQTVTVLPSNSVVPTFGPDGTIQVGNVILSHERASFNRATWRLGADWDITSRNLVYASYETGFKSGGFFVSSDVGVFQPEKMQAWTIGSKNRFFDNRLQINAEAFYWRYRDQQVSHLGIDSRGVTIFPTENVGRATFKGFELEGRVLAATNTLLSADLQYLDAQYDDFAYNVPNLGGPPISGCAVGALNVATNNFSVDCSGQRPPQAPKWTLNLGVTQTIPLAHGGEIVLDAKTHYQSRTLTSLEFVAQEYQRSYWMSDARVTYNASEGRWFVGAFINNIENETVMGSSFQLPFSLAGNIVGILRPPRTYGVRAGVNF